MKLLHLCVAAAVAAAITAGPHVVRAQALGEAATLSAGLSSAGSASGSALGNRIGRVMKSEGRRAASSSNTSNSGGVVNLHWSRRELERSAATTRRRAKGNAKVANQKAQPDFVIFGADPPNEGSEDSTQSKPQASHSSASQPKFTKVGGSSSKVEKNVVPVSH